jgi:hypothetical protein
MLCRFALANGASNGSRNASNAASSRQILASDNPHVVERVSEEARHVTNAEHGHV